MVARRCERRKLRLCVRDWTAVNFIPSLSPLAPAASGVLEQRLFLQQAGYELREIAFLRRSQAIFESLRTFMPGFKTYSLTMFAEHYDAYLQAVADCPKVQLEEFTRNPDATLRRICEVLGLDFPPKFKDEFHGKETVTGNNTLKNKPPSASATRITPGNAAPTPAQNGSARERSVFAGLDALAGYGAEANS